MDCVVPVIYTPNDIHLKKNLWEYLKIFKSNLSKPWRIMGDLNETMPIVDRKGGGSITCYMKVLQERTDSITSKW